MSLGSILESSIPLLQTSSFSAAIRSIEHIEQLIELEPGEFAAINDVGDKTVGEPGGLDEVLADDSSTWWLQEISRARNSLVWHGSGRAVSAAYCQIAGPGCPYSSDHFRFGIFMIPARYTYPSHVHGADEIYIPVAGRGEWAMDEGEFRVWPLNEVVPIVSMRPHAIRTGDEPLLTLYTWTGDISFDRYRYTQST